MPTLTASGTPSIRNASSRMPVASHQAHLYIKSAPIANVKVQGKRLLDAGALSEGAYECSIDITGWEGAVDVVLKPSAVSGGSFAPTLATCRLDGSAHTSAAGSNFAAATEQTLSITTLRGEQRAKVTFTVPATRTITFGAAAVAEYTGR